MKQAQGNISGEDFLRNLDASGLFAKEELNKAIASVSPSPDADGPSIANQLTFAGKLTPFQAEALLGNKVSDLLLGNYEILARLGAGGMGTVFKARHRRMKRVVAIKVMARNVVQDGAFLMRFQREVETVARLSHPNIVMAFDADEADAGPFLVMEYVNGRDLATLVQERGPLPLREAVDCILQAARGLACAHSQGIIHRDIKPANLLRDESGVVKVADLGLARLNDSVAPADKPGSLTAAGSVVGTVDYMPPEQAEDSTTIDQRADIYSLGCTLYFLLTGAPPFVANNLMATLLKHRNAPIPSLVAVRPEAPAALGVLFENMLAKKPADRCSSMAEIVSVLEVLLPTLPAAPVSLPASAPAALSDSGATVALRPLEPLPTTSRPFASTPITSETTVGHVSGLEERPSTQIPVLAAVTVLLVEPSRTQAVIVRKYLQDLGVEKIATISSGLKALEAIRASKPQLVISAMHLDDLTGSQLAQQVRADAALANIGFILISSEGDSLAAAAQNNPRTVVLRKPFGPEQLKKALRQAMG